MILKNIKRTSKKNNINLKNKIRSKELSILNILTLGIDFAEKILLKVFSYSFDFKVKNHYEFMCFFILIPLYHTKCVFLSKPIIARQTNTYSSEGDTLKIVKNFSNPMRLKQFRSFIFNKTKNKQLLKMLNNLEFIYAPNHSVLRIVIQKIVYLKLLLSKTCSNIILKKNIKIEKKNYSHIFTFIENYFKKK